MLTWVEISTSALAHNICVFKKLIGKKKLMAVIKSNAYGHGMEIVADVCARNESVDAFGVASVYEALELFKQGIRKTIIVLSILDVEQVAKMTQVQLNLISLPLYDMATGQKLFTVLKQRGLKAQVHVKIDTGTTRIGFLPSQISELLIFLQSAKKFIFLEALYTHFADAEDNISFTLKQNKILLETKNLFKKVGFKNFYTHSACTAATIRFADTHRDMIRLGLGLYGLNPNKKTAALIQKKTGKKLLPALSWHSKLTQVKTIPKGSTVGYGRSFKAHKAATIGVVPVGYFDGYDRKLSNKGHVVIRGTTCPIAGRVSMNLTMIDLSKIAKTVKTGDTVTLIDRRRGAKVNADSIAQSIETINYEIVTRINPLIPRLRRS
ncbi:MAG: Alanine racemase [Candidatus Magasanikbacteria bacterium GW2011_GWC2_45_8]|uniref:Alanine racemase n=2 Tax=Candidatus Magasanikiibacteriota TaxID=1752731 RepID=A0A0G1MX84_9BACT|nr:MAG: Alanine racemase [Candidatus Magasanikbacteria bacterium GW2011_GWC2_45_8]HBW73910.1 alanine racemase [Candidatus Magasanikbacteria bacterium]